MTPEELVEYGYKHKHPPVAKSVILVDFDGTIKPWGNELFGFPKPSLGIGTFIRLAKMQGYQIVIFTSRLSRVWHEHEGRNPEDAIPKQEQYITEYLKKWYIPFDAITAEKIPSVAIIDDRAIEYNGNIDHVYDKLRDLV